MLKGLEQAGPLPQAHNNVQTSWCPMQHSSHRYTLDLMHSHTGPTSGFFLERRAPHLPYSVELYIYFCRPLPTVATALRRWISAQGRVPLSNLMMRSANVLLECFGCGRWTTQFWRGCWFSRLLCPLQLHALCHSTRLWTMLLVWLLWPYLLFLGRADPACNLFEPHSNCCCLANSIGRCNWITPSKSMERQDIRYDPSMFKSGGLTSIQERPWIGDCIIMEDCNFSIE